MRSRVKRKVVFNATQWGLMLSEEAVQWMKSHKYKGDLNPIDRSGIVRIPRHHPLLVECVETLGDGVNGEYVTLPWNQQNVADLKVTQITGKYYYIHPVVGAGEKVVDITKMTDSTTI